MINKNYKNNSGFVMLFAIMLSSIILAIALGIANISLKEVNFSTSAKDTNDAFFAADTGAECALYADIHRDMFNPSNPGFGSALNCDDGSYLVSLDTPFYININDLTNCAKVTVSQDSALNTMKIESLGYNVDCSQVQSNSPKIVERAIRVIYNK
jgi:hypothetical protein